MIIFSSGNGRFRGRFPCTSFLNVLCSISCGVSQWIIYKDIRWQAVTRKSLVTMDSFEIGQNRPLLARES
ncbi:MAG TPA: hypothetical protein DEA96_11905 [Leptospiraceae bacterium]|nr:hypothetical protein [Spirochaetaceae bacterium]HBS05663.1 hypothetical protein [Leptospiraceae bacterium]